MEGKNRKVLMLLRLSENLRTIKKKEVLGFLVGGTSAVLVDYVSYLLLLNLGIERSISKATSYILGAIVGFVINKFFAFDSRRFSIGEISRYAFLYACTAGANTFTNYTVLLISSWVLFAFLTATCVSTVLNFLGQKFFVFNQSFK